MGCFAEREIRKPSVLGRGLSFWQDWGNIYGPVMAVTLNGSDPTIYLTNGTRSVLGLEGESTRTASVVQAAQEAYFAKTGVWPDVDGMPNKGGSPTPDPTIGTLTVTGTDLSGTSVRWTVGADTTLNASFDGDAKDVRFKWSIRTGTSAVIKSGAETATVVIEGAEVGDSGLLCTLSSDTASDSPQDKAFVCSVAS